MNAVAMAFESFEFSVQFELPGHARPTAYGRRSTSWRRPLYQRSASFVACNSLKVRVGHDSELSIGAATDRQLQQAPAPPARHP